MADTKSNTHAAIDTLLAEGRHFPPSAQFCAQATMADPAVYERAAADPVAFWEERARDLHWFTPWT